MRCYYVLASSVVLLIASDPQAAVAKPLSMTCSNPRREYVVRFDAEKRTLTATADEGPSPYTVSSYTESGQETVVSGQAAKNGPKYNAYFGAKPRMEFSIGHGIQTDLCRSVRRQ